MLMMLVGMGALAQAYTLSFTKLTSGTNYNTYTAAHDITCDGKGWSVYGNQSVGDNLRVGGKTTTATDRTLTSKVALVNSPIGSVSINHNGTGNGTNSQITINSIKVEGSTSSNFANSKTKIITSPSVSSAGKLTFSLDEGNWDANSYFKITVNYTVAITSGSSANNCYLTITSVEFNAGSSYEIVADANNDTYGTVTVDGTTITATPNTGYRISKTEPYTVLDGTASVTDNHDGTFTVDASEDCLIQINFEEIPLHIYNFYVNGISVSEDFAYEDTEIPFPSDPSDINGKVFRGWAEATISGTTNSAPTFVSSKTMGEDDINFYAVFATKNGSSVEYRFTLDPEDFSGASYTANDGTHSVEASATDASGATMTVNYTTANVMKQSGKIQFKTSGSYLYNTTDLGSIVSVSNGTATNLATTYGTSQNPSSGSLSTGQGYFKITANGGTGTSTGITVTFVKGNITYSNYCTNVPSNATITLNAACTDGAKVYSTYSNASAWVVPAELEVSEVGVNGESKLQVVNYTTGDVVPANTGVMVSADKWAEGNTKDFTITLSNAAGTSVLNEDNCLRPTGAGITADAMADADADCTYYRLTMHNGTQIGFWWGAAEGVAFALLAANKAYLAVPNSSDARVQSFWFGEETAIEAVKAEQNTGVRYNMAGQRVGTGYKGIVIVNGKKMLNK